MFEKDLVVRYACSWRRRGIFSHHHRRHSYSRFWYLHHEI